MPSAFSKWPLEALRFKPCTGQIPGRAFTAPGRVIAVTYNGVLLPRGLAAPKLSYTATAGAITLNFKPDPGDRIDALCVG